MAMGRVVQRYVDRCV